MNLIDLHKGWYDGRKLKSYFGGNGLCHAIPENYQEYLSLFRPDNSYDLGFPRMYWAHSENPPRDKRAWEEYTSLRQTIVLLICAMNNEL